MLNLLIHLNSLIHLVHISTISSAV